MRRVLAFVPALLWASVILWLGSRQTITIPGGWPIDKVGHFGMFAILGTLLAWGLHRAAIRASIAWPLLAGLVLGAVDELHQRTLPNRSSELADLVADVAGCAVALWLTHHLLERREARTAGRAPDEASRESNSIQEHRA